MKRERCTKGIPYLTCILFPQSFLYTAFYFMFSVLGHYNYFFFAIHLLDVSVCFKTLGTILQSVTHNGRQVCVLVFLRCPGSQSINASLLVDE